MSREHNELMALAAEVESVASLNGWSQRLVSIAAYVRHLENKIDHTQAEAKAAWRERDRARADQRLAEAREQVLRQRFSLRRLKVRMPEPRYAPVTELQQLGRLAEECGEVVQAVGKTIRWGLDNSNPELEGEGETNRAWIARELCDLQGAIIMVAPLLGLEVVDMPEDAT